MLGGHLMGIIWLQEEIENDLETLCNIFPGSIGTEVSEFLKSCCLTVMCVSSLDMKWLNNYHTQKHLSVCLFYAQHYPIGFLLSSIH